MYCIYNTYINNNIRISLAVSKARLDGALSTLLWWKGSLPVAGGWNQMVCKVPPNPYSTVIL